MATINFDSQDAKDNATINALAAAYGYQSTILNEEGQPIPNPETKTQFARKRTRIWWREQRALYAVNSAVDAAREAALADLANNDPAE